MAKCSLQSVIASALLKTSKRVSPRFSAENCVHLWKQDARPITAAKKLRGETGQEDVAVTEVFITSFDTAVSMAVQSLSAPTKARGNHRKYFYAATRAPFICILG